MHLYEEVEYKKPFNSTNQWVYPIVMPLCV